jgi:hypothetical protein
MRRIFEPKRDEVRGCWRKFYYNYRILVGKSEGRRPLGTSRHRWEDNIKIGLKEVGYEGVDWIHLA